MIRVFSIYFNIVHQKIPLKAEIELQKLLITFKLIVFVFFGVFL